METDHWTQEVKRGMVRRGKFDKVAGGLGRLVAAMRGLLVTLAPREPRRIKLAIRTGFVQRSDAVFVDVS